MMRILSDGAHLFQKCPDSRPVYVLRYEGNFVTANIREVSDVWRSACVISTLLAALTLPLGVFAGDRDGISEALNSIPATWPEALFSIEVSGATDDTALLNHRLDIVYEAKLPGYLAYLMISSHGDMTLYRDPGRKAKSSGTESYVVKPPLGSGQVIVMFANAPWDSFFPKGGTAHEVGTDRDDAQSFVQQLSQLQSAHVLLSNRRFQLTTAASAGGTEYTTRGIVLQVQQTLGERTATSGGVARIPSRIEFEFGSDRLTQQGKLDLDTFGEALVTGLRDSTVALQGHTDAVGTDDYNQALSERRARAARQYLIDSFGIADSRMTTAGMGKNDPIASNDDPEGRSRNRRVDFIFSAGARPPGSAGH
jgi:outer membrane protein OmpA-like peptidoglycan-associated protein